MSLPSDERIIIIRTNTGNFLITLKDDKKTFVNQPTASLKNSVKN